MIGAGTRGGFTLVELMLVLSGLALVGLASMSLELSTTNLSDNIASTHYARMGARMKLDEIRTCDFEQLVDTYNGKQFDVDIDGDGAHELQPRPGELHVGSVRIEPTLFGRRGEEAVRVIVEMRWRSRSGDQSYRLFSMRSRP